MEATTPGGMEGQLSEDEDDDQDGDETLSSIFARPSPKKEVFQPPVAPPPVQQQEQSATRRREQALPETELSTETDINPQKKQDPSAPLGRLGALDLPSLNPNQNRGKMLAGAEGSEKKSKKDKGLSRERLKQIGIPLNFLKQQSTIPNLNVDDYSHLCILRKNVSTP